MGHSGAANTFNQRFFDDSVFHIQGKLACSLLGRAPADAMCKAGNIFDFFDLCPFALLRYGGGAVFRAFGDYAHLFNFMSVHREFRSFFGWVKYVCFIRFNNFGI